MSLSRLLICISLFQTKAQNSKKYKKFKELNFLLPAHRYLIPSSVLHLAILAFFTKIKIGPI